MAETILFQAWHYHGYQCFVLPNFTRYDLYYVGSIWEAEVSKVFWGALVGQ